MGGSTLTNGSLLVRLCNEPLMSATLDQARDERAHAVPSRKPRLSGSVRLRECGEEEVILRDAGAEGRLGWGAFLGFGFGFGLELGLGFGSKLGLG